MWTSIDVHRQVSIDVHTRARVDVHTVCIMAYISVYSIMVGGCSCTFFEGVHVGRSTDKICLIDQAIRRRTDLPLVDELVECRAGDTELARGVGFGQSSHERF